MHIINPKASTKIENRDFPGGLMVRILGFHYHGPGSIPGQGTETPQAAQPKKKEKKRKSENKMGL